MDDPQNASVIEEAGNATRIHGHGAKRKRECHVRGSEVQDWQQPRRQMSARCRCHVRRNAAS